MQITYLSDVLYSTNFIYSLLFLTLVIWVVLKYVFHHDNVGHALVFAIMAMIFLPFVVMSTQFGNAFVTVLILGALAISQAYKWPLSTSVVITLIALILGAMILPSF